MNGWAVDVYVEGGRRDGETFIVGPFQTEAEAEDAAATVGHLGTAQVVPCYAYPQVALNVWE